MKKHIILSKFQILFFFIFLILEVISYNYNFFIIFNSFFAAIVWFHIIYYLLGFTAKEHALRMKEPIKFKFSLFYLLKLIKRGIKIKFILIKNFVFDKKNKLRKIISVVLLITISLIIVIYFRWSLLLEIFKTFNITIGMLK